MRRSILVFGAGLLVGTSLVLAADYSAKTLELSKPYAPSRAEWLELSAFKVIKDRTDMWERRIGFWVSVVEKERTVFVTLTSANGQEPLTSSAAEGYVATVRDALRALLDGYDWARELKLHVQFS